MLDYAVLHAPIPRSVQVTVDDRGRYRLSASRSIVRFRGHRGALIRFGLVNRGEDPHDLTVRRVRDGRIFGTSGVAGPIDPLVGPVRLKLRLPRGTYVLFCSIGAGTSSSHEVLGMRQRFVVRRRT